MNYFPDVIFHTAKPIDLLAKYISAEDDELAIEMHEPYTYLHVSLCELRVTLHGQLNLHMGVSCGIGAQQQ